MSECRGCGQMHSDIERLSANNAQLRQQLEQAEARVLELQEWQRLTFDAHPNIDLDIEHQAYEVGEKPND